MIKESDKAAYDSRPMVDGRKILLDGKVLPWDGAVQEVTAPIYKVRARVLCATRNNNAESTAGLASTRFCLLAWCAWCLHVFDCSPERRRRS